MGAKVVVLLAGVLTVAVGPGDLVANIWLFVTLALVAVGLLVLTHSATVRRSRRIREQLAVAGENLARYHAYHAHVQRLVRATGELSRDADFAGTATVMLTATRAIMRLSRKDSSDLLVIRTDMHTHRVIAVAGAPHLGIDAGKSWSARRPLNDVLLGMSRCYWTTPINLGADEHQLVCLSADPLAPPEIQMLSELEAVLTLVGRQTRQVPPFPKLTSVPADRPSPSAA